MAESSEIQDRGMPAAIALTGLLAKAHRAIGTVTEGSSVFSSSTSEKHFNRSVSSIPGPGFDRIQYCSWLRDLAEEDRQDSDKFDLSMDLSEINTGVIASHRKDLWRITHRIGIAKF